MPRLATSGFYYADAIQRPELSKVSNCQVTLEMNKGRIVGTIKFSYFVGEITALGVIGELNNNAALYHNAETWKDLYSAKATQCLFTKQDSRALNIEFIVDRVRVAYARVVPAVGSNVGDVLPTRSSCYWS